MTMTPSLGSFCPPSQLQLALALAIVKSKPGNITVRDHILGLRKHIRAGKRKLEGEPGSAAINDAHGGERHVDSASFWREAYEKSEAAQSLLLDKIYELEQRNENFRLTRDDEVSVAQLRSGSSSGTGSATKRKTRSDDVHGDSGTGTQKRGKTASARGLEGNKLGVSHGKVVDSFEVPQDPITSLLRRFYNLRKLLQRKVNADALSLSCVDLCEAAAKSIGYLAQNPGLRSLPSLEQALDGIEHCYPSLLQSLKKISTCEDSAPNNTGLIIYHMVSLFQTTIEQLHIYTTAKAKDARGRTRKPKAKSRSKATKTMPSEPTHHPLSQDAGKVIGAFCHLLATMILSLDPARMDQQDLLEGYMYVLLRYIGRTLGLFVFKDLTSNPEIRTDKLKLLLPDSLLKTPIDSADFAVRELVAVWESKHLLWVLDRAMAFIVRHNLGFGAEIESDPATSNGTSSTQFFQSGLLKQVRDKLQSTLLLGVFGDHEPSFQDSLKMPVEVPAPAISVGSSQDVDPGEWFTQEIWRLVGWDMLLRGGPRA